MPKLFEPAQKRFDHDDSPQREPAVGVAVWVCGELLEFALEPVANDVAEAIKLSRCD